DVEDAFQATFLVLVRKAGAVRKRSSVRSWLYSIALRVSAGARERQARQRRKEAEAQPTRVERPGAEQSWAVLDEEISRLPEKYRQPILLCYLSGQTNEEAARRLGCPAGTIATRLARARERLRGRLERRGVALPAVLLSATVPESLFGATVR